MFKLKTSDQFSFAILMIGVCFSLSIFSVAWANNNNNNSPSVDCSKEAKEVAAVEARDANGRVNVNSEAYKRHFRNAYNTCRNGGNEVGCKKDLKDLNDAKSKLVSSCGAARLPSSGSAGNIACSDSLKTCERATDERVPSDSDLPYDTDSARSMPAFCPVGSENIKEVRQELKDAKENLDKLQDEVPELQKQITEAQSAGQDELLQLQEQQQQAQKQCQDEQKQLQRNLLDHEREIYNNVQKLYQEMRKFKDQIAQAENKKVEAGIRFSEAVYNLEIGCYRSAMEIINAKRKKVLGKVDKSEYNLGGFNQFVSSTGLTTRQQDQQSAMREFHFCKNGGDHKKAVALEMKKHEASLAMIDREISSLEKELAPIQQQIGVMQNNDIARMRTETQQDLADIKNHCYEQNALITQKMGQATMKSNAAVMTAQQDLSRKQLRLQEAEAEYKNIRDFHRIKNSGGGGDSEKFYEANAALADYEGKARSFKLSCCGDVDGMATTCNEIAAYMGVTNQTTIDTNVATTPSPASASPESPSNPAATPRTPARQSQQQLQLPDGNSAPVPPTRPNSGAAGAAGAREMGPASTR